MAAEQRSIGSQCPAMESDPGCRSGWHEGKRLINSFFIKLDSYVKQRT
jgi:hypothetical protein